MTVAGVFEAAVGRPRAWRRWGRGSLARPGSACSTRAVMLDSRASAWRDDRQVTSRLSV